MKLDKGFAGFVTYQDQIEEFKPPILPNGQEHKKMSISSYEATTNYPKIQSSSSAELAIELDVDGKLGDPQIISHTLTLEEFLTLWSWLPMRITVYEPVLLFSTEEDGVSFKTFFNRIENYEQTLLLIKTTLGHVFGAFCSSSWSNRRRTKGYFGTGETFLFSLTPKLVKYPWAGLNLSSKGDSLTSSPSDSANSSASSSTSTSGEHGNIHGCDLFQYADMDMLYIGGGSGIGICLDKDLRFGTTDACQTFNNNPLTSQKGFEILVLEVFGFD